MRRDHEENDDAEPVGWQILLGPSLFLQQFKQNCVHSLRQAPARQRCSHGSMSHAGEHVWVRSRLYSARRRRINFGIPSQITGTPGWNFPIAKPIRVFYHTVKYTSMSADPLSSTFAALADPTRRAILARLASGESSVTELAKPFKISLPAITKHLKVLERSGLIARSRDAQWRPCRLEAAPMKEAVDWLQHYRRHWEESFDRLDDYLKQLQAKEKKHDHRK
jgi:DNA-binding transcriptional ArsR family regulator